MSDETNWSDYYRATSGRPLRPLFIRALELAQLDDRPGRQAIDLGCGDGTETLHLLASGWRVLAVDAEQAAIDLLWSRVTAVDAQRLVTQVSGFEAVQCDHADLVYAGFSLFFCPPETFPAFWSRLRSELRPGALFAAHLLGERDTWAHDVGITSFDSSSVRRLFDGFTIEHCEEVEHDKPAVSGPKHWHLFEVVARKS